MLLAHVAHGHLGWGGNSPFGEEILRDVDVFADEVFHIQSSTDRESSIEKRRTMHIGHVDLAHLNVRHEVARGNTGEVNTRRHTANKGRCPLTLRSSGSAVANTSFSSVSPAVSSGWVSLGWVSSGWVSSSAASRVS